MLNLNRPGAMVPLVPLAPDVEAKAARSAAGLPRSVPASARRHWPEHVRSPAQRAVWTALEDGPATATELGMELGYAANRVSAILCRWRDAGLVRAQPVVMGRFRPVQIFERVE